MQPEATVFIVDDDKSILDSLNILFKLEGLQTELHDSCQSFLDCYDAGQGGCLLLDVRMPGMSGLELQEKLVEKKIDIPVIIMTGHGDIKTAVNAMKLGAHDFIEKPFRDDEIIATVRNALQSMQEKQENSKEIDTFREQVEQLTAREQEVLSLLVQGNSNKSIAAELNISPRTAEIHRAHIKEKLRARNLSHLIRMAIEAGL